MKTLFYTLPNHKDFKRTELEAVASKLEDGTWKIDLQLPHLSGTTAFYGAKFAEANKAALQKCKHMEQYALGLLSAKEGNRPYTELIPTPWGWLEQYMEGVQCWGTYTMAYSRTTQKSYGDKTCVGQWQKAWGDENLGRGYGCGYVPTEAILYQNVWYDPKTGSPMPKPF